MPGTETRVALPMFTNMNIIMVPIILMSTIIAEEKEKGTLRVLIMSNVQPMEYLIGIGFFVFIIAVISTALFLITNNIETTYIFLFLATSLSGIICSILIGAIIGLITKNQMSTGPLSGIIAMVLGMVPMFANMNNSIRNYSKYLYSQSVFDILFRIKDEFTLEKFTVIGVNALIFLIIFYFIYKRKKLAD
jgi:ABC-2 type transport system permease protein